MLCSYRVDGYVYAQPLYVAGVEIEGKGNRDVVYVATEHDSVYAFDAHCAQPEPLWHTSFIDPANGITTMSMNDVLSVNTGPEVGITGTPVIALSSNTLYVVAATKENGNFVQRLHALDIRTGKEKPGPEIRASVPGTGDASDGSGNVRFLPVRQNQRPALLLVNGILYIGWGSHHTNRPWHGWLAAYDASTLQQVAVFNATPDGWGGGIWQSGNGPVADGEGNIFIQTGQGSFSAHQGGRDYGNSVLKLSQQTLTLTDFFTPHDQDFRRNHDIDMGTSGPILLPGQPNTAHPKLLLTVSKDGNIYLIDREVMGQFNPDKDAVVQIVPRAVGVLPSAGSLAGNGAGYNTPAYWNGLVYFGGRDDVIKAVSLQDGRLSGQPVSRGNDVFDVRGAGLSVSAKGSQDGIVWALGWRHSSSVLYAYDATNVSRLLYSSEQSGSRDSLPARGSKFAVPTVFNGKVYVGGEAHLVVFGLLN